MKNLSFSAAPLALLGLISLLVASCGSLEPIKEKKEYTGGPIKLERPSHTTRPYRKKTSLAAPYREEARVAQPYTEEAPLTQTSAAPAPEPVPYRVNGKLVTPGMFHTPDDLALPTDNQVSDGL